MRPIFSLDSWTRFHPRCEDADGPSDYGSRGVALTIPYAGTDGTARFLFFGFALIEGTAAVLFAFFVVSIAQDRPAHRPAVAFFVVGSLWFVPSVGLGVFLAGFPGTALRSSSAYDWITLRGFAGSLVFGITHEILPPYARRGVRSWRIAAGAHGVLATLGLVLVILSQVLSLAGYPRSSAAVGLKGFGLLLGMVLSYAIGTFQTLATTSPPLEMVPSRR